MQRHILLTALDIARGLEYLHHSSRRMVHRDLSATNILLTTSTADTRGFRGLLSDFGEAWMGAGESLGAAIIRPSLLHYLILLQSILGVPCFGLAISLQLMRVCRSVQVSPLLCQRGRHTRRAKSKAL